jgi:hypothetical protein
MRSCELGGAGIWLNGIRQPFGAHHVSIKKRLRRLGWLGMWLVAQHAMRFWVTAPNSQKHQVVLTRKFVRR